MWDEGGTEVVESKWGRGRAQKVQKRGISRALIRATLPSHKLPSTLNALFHPSYHAYKTCHLHGHGQFFARGTGCCEATLERAQDRLSSYVTDLSLPHPATRRCGVYASLHLDCILQYISSGYMQRCWRFVESMRADERWLMNITHSELTDSWTVNQLCQPVIGARDKRWVWPLLLEAFASTREALVYFRPLATTTV